MADVAPLQPQQLLQPDARNANLHKDIKGPHSPSVSVPQPPPGFRSGHLGLQTFSPVNENGSFAYDRVLKSGEVHKRTRKTKQWKPFHLVLRPNLLSLYKSHTEEQLLKKITLSDLTAVAYLKDPKGRRQHLFGLYSPSRNWHLRAESAVEARSWVELIKLEARIDEEGLELDIRSPTAHHDVPVEQAEPSDNDRLASSSPEPSEGANPWLSSTIRDGLRMSISRRLSAPSIDYSGDEVGPYSDFSDTPPQSLAQQSGPLGSFKTWKQKQPTKHQTPYAAPLPQQQPQPTAVRNASQASGFPVDPQDQERVIWHGYLLYLKSKGGVKQWKRTWVVLRPKNLAFYKNDEEYAANLILPLSNIISAVEIDPISKSKNHCMQIIAEDKSYRFCAPHEDALAEWLGALKSHLAKRKEKENQAVKAKV